MKTPLFPLVALGAALGFSNASAAGPLNVPGTGDGIEMLRAVGAAFTADNPEIPVAVPPSIGSGGAVVAVAGDREVIGRIARPLSDTEKAQGLVFTPVVRIPSAFFVHADAKVSELTSKQIADIYSGEVTNWKDVGGADLRIKVVRREDGDSTLAVLRASMPGWKDLVLTGKSKTALTTQEAVETVRAVEGSVGFGPYSSALKDTVAVVKIDGKAPTDPGYPSAVVMGLIHKASTVTADAKAFIAYTGGDKASAIISGLGGVPIAQ
ncbi:phosphate ABC transporter substrate-binding protein [Alsobacter soli]|uniref:Phosphate ABC transporter substrate-binding protein n=1 Tax=Alsobacter soli TaxID=2109933 RepID=A0A2T1HTE7_9HYPH|nr:substrate-binding domain-containing protein [Alsobacter soli]PSC04926.1 phosphate ABC transporter substrate-binding protein [Alsobacter soli]